MRADRSDFGRPPLVAVVAAPATFLYVSIIVKVAKYGF